MKWAYRIATIGGIDLKLHVTFGFIILIAAMSWATAGAAGIAFGVGLILLLFACVTLHEFGHALAARSYGIPVREVVLLPIGGIAMLEQPIRRPIQELVIAAAGPAVNVAIIALLIPVLYVMGEPITTPPSLLGSDGMTPSFNAAVHWLLGANLTLVLFNLVPAFPLDGGRILRGILGLFVEWSVATRWAARTGQLLAVGMGGWAVLQGHPMLAATAAFIFFAAASTDAAERAHTVLSQYPTGTAYTRRPVILTETDRVNAAAGELLTTYQTDFAVMRGSTLLGVVQQSDILRAVAAGGGESPVTSVMRQVVTVTAADSLDHTVQQILASGISVAAVYRDTRFAGLISLDDIREAEAVFSAVGASRENATRTPGAPGTRRWHVPVEA